MAHCKNNRAEYKVELKHYIRNHRKEKADENKYAECDFAFLGFNRIQKIEKSDKHKSKASHAFKQYFVGEKKKRTAAQGEGRQYNIGRDNGFFHVNSIKCWDI